MHSQIRNLLIVPHVQLPVTHQLSPHLARPSASFPRALLSAVNSFPGPAPPRPFAHKPRHDPSRNTSIATAPHRLPKTISARLSSSAAGDGRSVDACAARAYSASARFGCCSTPHRALVHQEAVECIGSEGGDGSVVCCGQSRIVKPVAYGGAPEQLVCCA